MTIPSFYLEPATYTVDFDDIRFVRTAVFVDEQQIDPDVEFDELDPVCHHLLARDSESRPIGTARLAPDGRIGRMAVVTSWRRQGVGASMLRMLIERARQFGFQSVYAHAQTQALQFYQAAGFQPEGGVFVEAGIPHQVIRLPLSAVAPLQRAPRPRSASVEPMRLAGIEDTTTATVALIEAARRQVSLLSRDLDAALYGDARVVEAFKQFALQQRNALVHIVIQEPTGLRGRQHPLLDLAQRLPSHFLLRSPVENDDVQYPSAFLINDDDGYLFRLNGGRFEGHWSPNAPAKSRQLRDEFDRIWQRALPCTEFRALGL